jgi:glucosamine--fructose-6-phosphate aminotransferase (isomerizing)
MCGIVGYIGFRDAYPLLIKGLRRLEYRGYDSAGIALLDQNHQLHIYKKRGKVSDLDAYVNRFAPLPISHLGIGHTRWATHGEPNDQNAHPHVSQNRQFVVIHNGIIENYAELKKRLESRGYHFQSETDTEVLAHLFEEIHRIAPELPLDEVVRLALRKVIGAFGIVVMSPLEPNMLIAARRSSPIVIGIGNNEYFIASDATPIIEYTKEVIYLEDDELAVIKNNAFSIKTLSNHLKEPEIIRLEMDIETIEKGGYPHFMLKEIFEQPRTIYDSLRGRIRQDLSGVILGGLLPVKDRLVQAKRIIITSCGTSWHAGLVGEYLIESLARIPVEVEYASEFRYRNPVLYPDDVVIAISQSGETADTLAAVRLAKSAGALVLGICNVVGSSIARETHAGVYIHAGPEIGVASTKAFTSQLVVLTLMSLLLAEERKTLDPQSIHYLVKELLLIPDKVKTILENTNEYIKALATIYKEDRNFLYLGRGYHFPIALEGALKLKEISYIHAEGYPAAEMKHGPIALIDENMPCVILALKDTCYDKIVANVQEVKARHGRIIAIVNEGDTTVSKLADHVIEIPHAPEPLSPILSVIPLQLLAYHIAVLRGCDVDQPRNLAKSVTVE